MVNGNTNNGTSGNSAGVSSTTGGSSAGGGSVNGNPPAGVIPPGTLPPHSFRKEVTTVAAAIEKQFPDGTSLVVLGQSVSKASLIAALQAVLGLFAAVDADVLAVKSDRLVLKTALPSAHQLLVGIKDGLIALYGRGNPALEAFGFNGTKSR
ncbi:MAG: hypothetical protein ACYCWW_14920, partial [Deltaproteobacteria bacterium]